MSVARSVRATSFLIFSSFDTSRLSSACVSCGTAACLAAARLVDAARGALGAAAASPWPLLLLRVLTTSAPSSTSSAAFFLALVLLLLLLVLVLVLLLLVLLLRTRGVLTLPPLLIFSCCKRSL
jgi:hypothetical protein